jgi:hypothetical protein
VVVVAILAAGPAAFARLLLWLLLPLLLLLIGQAVSTCAQLHVSCCWLCAMAAIT